MPLNVRIASLLLPFGGVASCFDWSLSKVDDDGGTGRPDAPHSADDTGAMETCDGVDNDHDGSVDEGFPDADADGIADCVDVTCTVNLSSSREATSVRNCPLPPTPIGDGADLDLVWSAGSFWSCPRAVVGDVDRDGLAEVVCAGDHAITVLSGQDGHEILEIPLSGDLPTPPVVLADVDSDGQMDLVTVEENESWEAHLVAFGLTDGERMWTSSSQTASEGHAWMGLFIDIQAQDMDGNGTVDLITHGGIFRGSDGALLSAFELSDYTLDTTVRQLAIADIDRDGRPDVIDGFRRLSADGASVWDVSGLIPEAEQIQAIPLIVQADGDEEGEVAIAGMYAIYVVDTDGTPMGEIPVLDSDSAPFPCVADLDGDGLSEVVYKEVTSMRAVHLDGSELWSIPSEDTTSNSAECTTFDVDADGVVEVFMNDESELRMLKGSNGLVSWRYPIHSGTAGDRPQVVDLDGDGAAELLSATVGVEGREPTVRVFRSSSNGWAPALPYWPNSNWSGAGLWPDGSAQASPPAAWLEWGIFRGQPPLYDVGSDVTVEVIDQCVDSCTDDGVVRVAVTLANLGPQPLRAGARLIVSSMDPSGTRVQLSAFTTTTEIPSGERATPAWEVDTTVAQARLGLVFAAESPDGQDCDRENDEVTWSLADCG